MPLELAPIPQRIDASDIEFPPAEAMFESEQEAHDFLMGIVGDVCAELKADGVPLPAARRFAKDCLTVWLFWQRGGYIRKAA